MSAPVTAEPFGPPPPRRRRARRLTVLVLGVSLALSGAALSSAGADGGAYQGTGARLVADGFQGPTGVSTTRRGFLVADPALGQVLAVRAGSGAKRVVLRNAAGVTAAVSSGRWMWSLIGEQGGPRYGGARVLRTDLRNGRTSVLANLLRYERRHNPDGQTQFADGSPVETLSNPYALTLTPRGLLVADAGANAVLRVGPRSGRVSTFFVPPVVTSGVCEGEPNNPGTTGCDPVPTGVTTRGGKVYVSTAGALAPGAGRVYRLNPRGRVERAWRGLTAPTSLAVGPGPVVYAGQAISGAPDGPPGPGFDPAEIGSIVRIRSGGVRSVAQVTMPGGLVVSRGRLFATAWSVAPVLGIPDAGQLLRVSPGQFAAA